MDQNKARFPSFPLLPLVLAVNEMQPDFEFRGLDLVTDRNNIRKLFSFLEGQKRDFRIDVEVGAGGTVFFMRTDKMVVQEEVDNPFHRTSFIADCTTPHEGCEQSTGHCRIIQRVSPFCQIRQIKPYRSCRILQDFRCSFVSKLMHAHSR